MTECDVLFVHARLSSMFNTENSFNVLYTTDVDKTAGFFETLGVTARKREADKVVVEFGGFDQRTDSGIGTWTQCNCRS